MSNSTDSTSDTEPGRTWIKDALCASPDYAGERNLWFSQKKDQAGVRKARQICWSCPSLEACGRWAFETRQPFGVWGGVTEGDRRAALRRRGIRIKDIDDEDELEATA